MLNKLLKIVSKNELIKITSINSIAVFLQMLSGVITSKVIAIYLGESGMAIMGFMRNFMDTSKSLSTLGIGNGIVKYTADYRDDEENRVKVFSTSFFLCFLGTLLTSICLYFGASYWNVFVFKGDYDFEYIFKFLAISLPFHSFNVFLISIINGFSKYKTIVKINIIATIFSLILTVFLITKLGIEGALQAVIYTPIIIVMITIFMITRMSDISFRIRVSFVSSSFFKKLVSYTGMAVFSAILLPIVYIAIRKQIILVSGIDDAGYWDAMTRISNYYFKFITVLLGLYILPQLAKAQDVLAFRKEIFGFYKTILPIFSLGLILIFVLKDFLIVLLLTEDFLPMTPIFKWQLIGDLFKVASIVIGYQILAKNMFKLFIITEVISVLTIYLSSMYFIHSFGYVGAAMGHCVSYMLHFVMMILIFRKELFGKIPTT